MGDETGEVEWGDGFGVSFSFPLVIFLLLPKYLILQQVGRGQCGGSKG